MLEMVQMVQTEIGQNIIHKCATIMLTCFVCFFTDINYKLSYLYSYNFIVARYNKVEYSMSLFKIKYGVTFMLLHI